MRRPLQDIGLAASRCLALALAPALAGCDPAPATPDAAAPSASSVVSAAPASDTSPPPKAPDDLEVASLQKALKCASDAKSGACGVLARFTACKAWDANIPSGDGRWIGRGHTVEGAKTFEIVALMRARRVPTTETAEGHLPLQIAVTDLPKQEGAAYDQAGQALRAFERADVPPKSNATLEYIKNRTSWPDAAAMRTRGGQIYAITKDGTFVCQGDKRQLLVVQRGAGRSSNPDGLYAELWPTSW